MDESSILSELFDHPIMQQLDINPEGILLIPKDCYERIMQYYLDNELYEKCAVLQGLNHKVSERTIHEMIAEYSGESTIIMLRLAQIIELLSSRKRNK